MITRKYIENYEHEVLIGIQFVLEVYMYRHDYEKTQKTNWSLFMDRIDVSPGFVSLLGCRITFNS